MYRIIYLLVILLLLSCGKKSQLDYDYLTKLNKYRIDKMNSRKDGYLKLVVLSKLNDSVNVFGKHSDNNLVLNIESLPDTIGIFRYRDSILNFKANKAIKVSNENDSLITSVDLTYDEYGSSQKLKNDRLKWQIITRANSHFLRVWDAENPEIKAFRGFNYFDPTSEFIFDADFTHYKQAKTEKVKSQLGVQASTNFIGKVDFNYNGQLYSLDVGTGGFVMVADDTNDKNTYGGGRYVYIDVPETDGKVTLDFNKLYNPPCSYNDFTTCLYPPRQNHLPFELKAGETIERI